MQTAAIALIVVLLVGMACGLEITWAFLQHIVRIRR